ncbi:Calcineurin-like phosphoesterase superfamily domain protein [Rosistilla ulvae]|uniref:Calcineurin-like phosphoesterase superfamily domain protein n=1 Tax=Rosistilla ulvae TaxID=1930277 RepID=A0A517LYY2_9BACT|nr:metallophosphoesterase [Rosistilla ulvae]QDS87818.1 Calcineurin-like phosphoesterase superfamily domain protein [Rosistilla ulvae]
MNQQQENRLGGRRAFMKNGTLILSAAAAGPTSLLAAEKPAGVRVALVTDLHYADKPPGGSRHYRKTLGKLDEAAKQFEREQPQMLVELGDLIDAADSVETESRYLQTINRPFSAICKDRHYVLGNHCVDTLKKEEFLGAVEQPKSYYSFDRGGFHFIVLDSCFRSDGQPYQRKNFKWTDANLPPAELDWLAADLKANDKPTIVFAHQRLDVSNHHGVKNNAAARQLFEASGNVLAVFQGHSHRNDLKEIGGIHYCTLVAMVEGGDQASNAYTLLDVQPDSTLKITGFRKQDSYLWETQS